MSALRCSALALCLVVLSLICATSVSADEAVPLGLSRSAGVWRPEKPVTEWTTEDVVLWLNYTIGYSEYAPFARKHRVDGLTLLEMEAADFEHFFPVENALHAIKMSAHLAYLQGKCHCNRDEDGAGAAKRQSITSFTQYIRAHPVRAWVEGATTLYFPRVSMLLTYIFDRDMYRTVVNGGATVPSLSDIRRAGDDADKLKEVSASHDASRTTTWTGALVYWVSFLVAPDLYMAYQCITRVQYSYVYMGFFAMHFIFQAFNEYVVVMMMYRGTAFEAGTSWLRRIWQLFSYTLFIPLAGPIVAYVMPGFLQVLLVWVLMANTLLMIIGLALLLIGGEYNNVFFGGGGGGAAAAGESASEAVPTGEEASDQPAHNESKTEKID